MARRPLLPYAHVDKAGGFSLLETLLATGLTALLAMTGALYITSTRRHTRVLHETDAFRLFLERAYAHACAYQEIVTLSLSEKEATALRENAQVLLTHTIRRGVSLRFEPGQSKHLYIYPSLSSSPATLHLRDAGEECSLIISLRSRFRVEC